MEYKVSELANKAGVTKRTIHYYISKGLLLPPEGSGVNSLYNDEHLERILLIITGIFAVIFPKIL